jgi:hypothetical protein
MLEGRKINLSGLKTTKEIKEETSFKSTLNFSTLKGTGIPAAYKSNPLVSEYEFIEQWRLADAWKKGIHLKSPTLEQREQFKAIVIVLKHKFGVEFPQGKDKI